MILTSLDVLELIISVVNIFLLSYVAWHGIRITVGEYFFNFIGFKNMR